MSPIRSRAPHAHGYECKGEALSKTLQSTPSAAALQVLRGANPFAKAASRGTLLPPGSPMHKAAAYDLDVLQKLAVPEPTLVSWISDVCADLPKEWAETGKPGPTLGLSEEGGVGAEFPRLA